MGISKEKVASGRLRARGNEERNQSPDRATTNKDCSHDPPRAFLCKVHQLSHAYQ